MRAFPHVEYRPEQFPGLVFRLKKPKTTMLIFKTGKMVCTGGKGVDEARRAILTVAQKLRKAGINIAGKPEIKITNIVASASLGGPVDLMELFMRARLGRRVVYEPDQFPAAMYRMEKPKVVFLIFSSGRIICVGAKREREVYEAVENLRRRLEDTVRGRDNTSEGDITYECVRCGRRVPSEDWERFSTFKCPYCSYKVAKKVRPPVIRRARAA